MTISDLQPILCQCDLKVAVIENSTPILDVVSAHGTQHKPRSVKQISLFVIRLFVWMEKICNFNAQLYASILSSDLSAVFIQQGD